MAKTAIELREKAKSILEDAKKKAAELNKRADEIEEAEDFVLFKKLKSSGRLAELKKEVERKSESPAAETEATADEQQTF